MGNRAVIQFAGSNFGMYVHWNGGYDSVAPFLSVAREVDKVHKLFKGCDPEQFLRRLALLWGATFEGIAECGPVSTLDCDNYDNGVYLINGQFDIVGRLFVRNPEQKIYPFDEVVDWLKGKLRDTTYRLPDKDENGNNL